VFGCRVGDMQAFRLLVRASPFLLGALAAMIWLRRIPAERPRLEPPRGPAEPPEHTPIDIVTVVDDLLLLGRG
jgi:hypothetical protein